MKIIRVKNYEEMSKEAAWFVIEKVRKMPNMTLGLATGGTPLGIYQLMIEDYKRKGTSYSDIITFNLDEYMGLASNHPSSYRYYMNVQLFDHINIQKQKTYVPHGDLMDGAMECKEYEEAIKQCGGIDLQVLGIGRNGHIGFNEPGSSFTSRTRIVELTDSTRQDNARYFNTPEEVPTHAITMGIATIMESKQIVLLASGEEKAEAMKILLQGEVNESFPASILNKHSNVIIVADEAALSGLN